MAKNQPGGVVGQKGVPHANRPLRSIKMLKPVCAECQFPFRPRWWMSCPHEPYKMEFYEEVVTPKIKESADGSERVVTGEDRKQVLRKEWNLTQVVLGERHNAGHGPQKYMEQKGFKRLDDFELPERCQYFDCWEENPPINVGTYGQFCSPIHAKLSIADADGIMLEALDPVRRRAQIRAIDISPDN